MTKAIDKIERVLTANILKASLTCIPSQGATNEELDVARRALPRSLSEMHVALLRRWNGLNLDIVRVYGATAMPGEIRGLAESQLPALMALDGAIAFGDDAAGFVYAELGDGQIVSWDSDGGRIEAEARTLDEFFDRLVFGEDSDQFAGEDWKSKLQAANVL